MSFRFGNKGEDGGGSVEYEGLDNVISSLDGGEVEKGLYTCDECGQETSNIKRHIKHNPDCEPRECDVRYCHYQASGKESLYNHKKYEHPYNEGIINCGGCGIEMDKTKGQQWEKHSLSCSFRVENCEHCGNEIDKAAVGNERMQQHDRLCQIRTKTCKSCGNKIDKTTSGEERLEQHDSSCNANISKCFYCGGFVNDKNINKDNHKDSCIVPRAYANRFDVDISNGHFVYTLRLESDSGEPYYYVGETSDPQQRIVSHIKGSTQVRNMEVKTIVSLEQTYTKERGLERERERAFEIARIYDTNNVLGGK